MLLCASLRSVSKRTRFLNVVSGWCDNGAATESYCCFNRNISSLMMQIKRVFNRNDCKRCITTIEHHEKEQHNNIKNNIKDNNSIQKEVEMQTDADIDEGYEKAIQTLNALFSNAETIRRSITFNNRQMPLDDTIKYLYRSGLNLDDLAKLSFIHVSGTKGKGSTCALTESILRAHGIKTGFFSSPHLVSVTERIRINAEPISKRKFVQAFWPVYERLEAVKETTLDMPAYFKFLTILCFHIFLAEKVDVVVLEVGIGGEFDCTNIIRNTKTIGITSLGLEHTQLLGDTLGEIAWQKAGIIKPGANVFTSATQSECLEVIRQRAAERNATLYAVPEFAQYFPADAKSQKLLRSLNNVTLLNGSLAIQLARDWLKQHKRNDSTNNGTNRNKPSTTVLNAPIKPLQIEKVLEGIINCKWPGRCQTVKHFNFNIHLDGAHTIESMHVCSDWFERVTACTIINHHRPKVLIFNATGERDSKKLLNILRYKNKFELACFVPNIAVTSAINSDITCDKSEQMKRTHVHADNWNTLCQDAIKEKMCEEAKNQIANKSKVFECILDAFDYIQKQYNMHQELDVLVTGSLHLIGATLVALNKFKITLEQPTLANNST